MKPFYFFIFFLTVVPAIGQAQKKQAWYVPDHVKVQYAGGIGFIAAGIGFESGNKKLQGDFMYGYVPESIGGVEIHSITSKLTWLPVHIKKGKYFSLQPITVGILVNYAFGKQYFLFSPEQYPYDYYGFPTAMHMGIFIGGMVRHKQLGLYYEIGSTDKELISFAGNAKSVAFTDILNVAAGIKFSFRKS